MKRRSTGTTWHSSTPVVARSPCPSKCARATSTWNVPDTNMSFRGGRLAAATGPSDSVFRSRRCVVNRPRGDVRLLLLGKAALLAHRLARPLAAESDEYEQRWQCVGGAKHRCSFDVAGDPRRRPSASGSHGRRSRAAARRPSPLAPRAAHTVKLLQITRFTTIRSGRPMFAICGSFRGIRGMRRSPSPVLGGEYRDSREPRVCRERAMARRFCWLGDVDVRGLNVAGSHWAQLVEHFHGKASSRHGTHRAITGFSA